MENSRNYNVGTSDYAKHTIQPWDIWKERDLNPFDADLIKRALRSKPGEEILDYQKMIHICNECISQLHEVKYTLDVIIETYALSEDDSKIVANILTPTEPAVREIQYQKIIQLCQKEIQALEK